MGKQLTRQTQTQDRFYRKENEVRNNPQKTTYILIAILLIVTITPILYILSYYDDCQKIGYEEAVVFREDGDFEVYCSREVFVKLP